MSSYCINCDSVATHKCGDCGDMEYCGQICQSVDWQIHQMECIGKKARRAKRWIQQTHMHKGAFTRKAKEHGMTPAEYQKRVLANPGNYSKTTVREANLRKTLVKF